MSLLSRLRKWMKTKGGSRCECRRCTRTLILYQFLFLLHIIIISLIYTRTLYEFSPSFFFKFGGTKINFNPIPTSILLPFLSPCSAFCPFPLRNWIVFFVIHSKISLKKSIKVFLTCEEKHVDKIHYWSQLKQAQKDCKVKEKYLYWK